MKSSVIDILIYLFEHYLDDDIDLDNDRDRIKKDLHDLGFDATQVSRALDWLRDLADDPEHDSLSAKSDTRAIRVFSPEEELVLDVECRGLIHFLVHIGVLDADNRETVIERVMALNAEVDVEQLKWIVLMVLFNQPGQGQSFFWIEDLVMNELSGILH